MRPQADSFTPLEINKVYFFFYLCKLQQQQTTRNLTTVTFKEQAPRGSRHGLEVKLDEENMNETYVHKYLKTILVDLG